MRLSILLAAIFAATTISPLAAPAADHQHMVFRAIRRSDDSLLVSLLRQGVPIDLRVAGGATPLSYAALWSDADKLELLLEHGADPNLSDDQGATALLLGAGSLEKVRLLLAAGADPNARSNLGNTPLIAAAAYPQSKRVVELLLEHGAEADTSNNR